jgi:hypothetical protein
MIWVFRLIALAVLIAIIRNWPKTSFIIALCIGLIWVNSDEKQVDKVQKNEIENVQNLNYSNKAQTKSNSNWQNNNFQSNANNTYYKPSKSNTKTYNNYNSENIKVRVGAVCRDGTTSTATGRGACSHHGGVDYWLYE